MDNRIENLEQEVDEVRREMASLKEMFGDIVVRVTAAGGLITNILASLYRIEEGGKSHLVCPTGHCQQRRHELPIFSGEDPCGWILKAERYFMLYGIEDGEKVAHATLSMEGKALNWLLWMEARNPIQGWEMFKHELMERFRSIKGHLAYEQLLSLRQSTTVAHYREQFELLSAPLREIPDEMLRCIFINGLNDDVKAEVKSVGSSDLVHVTSLAQEIEDRNKIPEMMEEVKLTRTHGKNCSRPNSVNEMGSGSMDPNENLQPLLDEDEGEICDKKGTKGRNKQVMGESKVVNEFFCGNQTT